MSALTSGLPGKSSRTSTHEMASPAMELTTATMAERTSVSSSAETASGLVTSAQNVLQPATEGLGHDRGQRQQYQEGQIGHGERGTADTADHAARPRSGPGMQHGVPARPRQRARRPYRETQVLDGNAGTAHR